MAQDIRELVSLLLICVLVIAGLQWFLLRFTHWSVAIAATCFIAFVISFLYVSLKHAVPNGGSNGPDASEFVVPMLAMFISLLCGLFIVARLSHNYLPQKTFIFLLAAIAVFAAGRYVYQYVENVTFCQKIFTKSVIEVIKEPGQESLVREISFQNTSNGITVNVDPDAEKQTDLFIPRSANKIIFHGFSTRTDRMFSQDFPFDYSLCKESEGKRMGFCFWLRLKVTLPIKIVLHSGGNASLYIDNRLVKDYQLSDSDLSVRAKQQEQQY
ncbi:hypothetical protein D0817_14620 [Flavobacterium cupreum]|uniref:Uncharacterized protein n=1 Tax=Flavobacterium cupreum TaxID=2133766 RepID=A0A434A687_9FLAO|nr:hypothetical protein [Flavobacterium cupreum]RUT69847.1 hypothetical protein D0817_14620 [Flavobacterium cupreum]